MEHLADWDRIYPKKIGAVICGVSKIDKLEDIESELKISLREHVPMVIVSTSNIIPQAVERGVLAKYNVDVSGVTVELLAGFDPNMGEGIRLLTQGLIDMGPGKEEGDSYSRVRRRGV